MKRMLTFGAIAISWCITYPALGQQSGNEEYRNLSAAEIFQLRRRVEDTIREPGVASAGRSGVIASPISGTLLMLAPEGQRVERGELVARFDDAELQEALAQQRIRLAVAEAEAIKPQAELASEVAALEGQMQRAMMEVELTELQRSRVVDEGGELALKLDELQTAARLAERRVVTTRQLVEAGQSGGTTAKERIEAEYQLEAAREELRLAESRLKWFETYQKPQAIFEADMAMKSAKIDVERIKQEMQKVRDQLEAQLRAAMLEVDAEKNRLEQIEDAITACAVVSPHEGMLVYPADQPGGRTSARIEEGASVREGQPLVQIYNSEWLRIKTLVNETSIRRVEVGQPARIQFDALGENVFAGRVEAVSPVPEPTSWYSDNVIRYAVWIRLDDSEEAANRVRLGMNALVEITTKSE